MSRQGMAYPRSNPHHRFDHRKFGANARPNAGAEWQKVVEVRGHRLVTALPLLDPALGLPLVSVVSPITGVSATMDHGARNGQVIWFEAAKDWKRESKQHDIHTLSSRKAYIPLAGRYKKRRWLS
jgi:hypothetical protein